jgi:circadian clock protein KaiC
LGELISKIKGLDEIAEKTFNPYSLVVIGGHPGAGKTTLAVSICRDNMDRGEKCLYISFQEDKDKLYRMMRNIGINLEEYEQKGIFKFVKLPVTLKPSEVIQIINELVITEKPRIIVIDSVTPVLDSLLVEPKKRALVQNYMYNLPKTINGIVILLAELPFGEENLKLGNIEFVADMLILLKYRLERGLLVREIEIKKARGSYLKMAKIPFAITNKGLRTFPAPTTHDIRVGGTGKYTLSLPILRDYIGYISKGESILVSCSPEARSLESILIILDLLATNKLKGLFISYRYGAEEGRTLVKEAIQSLGLTGEDADKFIDRYIEIRSINPSGTSMTELLAYETLLIEERKPDLVLFHGIDLFDSIVDSRVYFSELLNELFTLKKMGVIIARYGNTVNEEFYKRNASLSDIVIRGSFTDKCGGKILRAPGMCFYVWRRGKKPIYISEYEALVDDNLEVLKKSILKAISG